MDGVERRATYPVEEELGLLLAHNVRKGGTNLELAAGVTRNEVLHAADH